MADKFLGKREEIYEYQERMVKEWKRSEIIGGIIKLPTGIGKSKRIWK